LASEPTPPARTGALFPLAAACFFLSGTAALLYEVVWMRLLGLVFGHTVYAVTTVLAAYMGGLALGSLLAGRWADRLRRPLRTYGLLEAAIGAYCLATPWLFRATEAAYLWLSRSVRPGPVGAGLLHFAFAALILLPPTALMGATLPVLSRAVVQVPSLAASRVGTLYAVNTWGAVAGTAATGFLLLPALGLGRTVWLGVGLNLLVAALALLLERWALAAPQAAVAAAPAVESAGAPDRPEPSRLEVTVALVAIGVSGAASMAYEIAWTRALSLALGSSTYAFAAMLTTFLSGLALGALVVSRLLRRRRLGLVAFALVEAGIALLALLLLPLFGRLPEAMLVVLGRAGVTHGAALTAQFALSFLLMILPTLLVGATFPLVIAALGRGLERLGREVGGVYSANTVGTILGSMAAGFLLVPAIGIQNTVLLAAGANLAAGLAAVLVARDASGRVRIGAAAAVCLFAALALALPRWDPRLMTSGVAVYADTFRGLTPEAFRTSQQRRELLFYEEGLSTTVAVVRSPTAVSLSVNGKTDASTGRDMATQLLLGHMGALLLEEPRRALVIGLASGITVGAAAQHPFERIDVAEIEPAMLEASRFFEKENRKALSDPRVKVLVGDGRQILEAATGSYDLIVSEPSNPWIAGVASLFTREFYESARRHLSPNGVMVQWLQSYSIFTADVRMVMRTFQEVFPHVSVWVPFPGDFLLVATPGPATLDLGLVARRAAASPGLREDLTRLDLLGENLAFRFFLGEEDVRRFAAGAPLNTDDRPLLEFSAPLALYAGAATHAENEAAMRAVRSADRPRVVGIDPADLSGPQGRLRSARAHWREGMLEECEHELLRAGPPGALAPDLRAERARLLLSLGRLDEAFEDLSALSRLRPQDPAVRDQLRLLLALGEPSVAPRLEAARRPRAGRPYLDPAALGELVVNLGLQRGAPAFFALALEELDVAARLQPGRTAVHNNRAVALAKLGRPDEAAEAFRRAVALNPADARTRFNLGMLLERQGRSAEAAREYLEAARLEPGWPAPQERLRAMGTGALPAR
jgi:spermidine synthase